MPIDIVAGTVLMRAGLLLPNGMGVSTDSYSRQWDVITAPDAFVMDRSLRAAGWNFFFTAAAVRAVTFGRREGKNARQAVDRILSRIQAQHFNCVEISEISTRHFLGIPYLSVLAHARQIQHGQTLDDNSGRREAQRLADWAARN
jgi:hypothetical protein